jgi:MoxR-like ATPase
MLKTVIDYPKMDEERMVVRQNLKGSYEKVNQVVSVEQILAVREVYMDEKSRNTSLISFCHSIPRKYKLADLNRLSVLEPRVEVSI